VIHLHQVDLPDVVRAMRMSAPVVISAHVYSACTAGVYYFRPGHECTRAHGPGCVLNLIARGCAHT
jgi:trehalose utilization protein